MSSFQTDDKCALVAAPRPRGHSHLTVTTGQGHKFSDPTWEDPLHILVRRQGLGLKSVALQVVTRQEDLLIVTPAPGQDAADYPDEDISIGDLVTIVERPGAHAKLKPAPNVPGMAARLAKDKELVLTPGSF